MKKSIIVAAALLAALSVKAQTKRTDDFHAKYQLKEVMALRIMSPSIWCLHRSGSCKAVRYSHPTNR